MMLLHLFFHVTCGGGGGVLCVGGREGLIDIVLSWLWLARASVGGSFYMSTQALPPMIGVFVLALSACNSKTSGKWQGHQILISQHTHTECCLLPLAPLTLPLSLSCSFHQASRERPNRHPPRPQRQQQCTAPPNSQPIRPPGCRHCCRCCGSSGLGSSVTRVTR